MSTGAKDTKFTVLEGGAEASDTSTTSAQVTPTTDTPETEGDTLDETVEVSKKELDDLAQLLETFKTYILSHEDRLGNVEAFIMEWANAAAKVESDTTGKVELP